MQHGRPKVRFALRHLRFREELEVRSVARIWCQCQQEVDQNAHIGSDLEIAMNVHFQNADTAILFHLVHECVGNVDAIKEENGVEGKCEASNPWRKVSRSKLIKKECIYYPHKLRSKSCDDKVYLQSAQSRGD